MDIVRLENARNVLVETIEETLRSFDIRNFFNQDIIRRFQQATANPAHRIGSGGFGEIYPYPSGGQTAETASLVVKKGVICYNQLKPRRKGPSMAELLCLFAADGNLVYRFPNTDENKLTVWAPNYLTEGIIGTLISTSLKKYTSGFMRIYNIQYVPGVFNIPYTNPPSPPNINIPPTLYILSEKLGTLVGPNESPNEFMNNFDTPAKLNRAFFQIAQALSVAQMYYKFTHYDLHAKNIMVRPIMVRPGETPKTYIYELENGKYLALPPLEYEYVIIDYGLNRIETPDSILIGRTRYGGNLLGENPSLYTPDILDYGAFNPYIDLVGLLSNFIWYIDGVRAGRPAIAPIPNAYDNIYDHILNLLKIALNIPYNTPSVEVYNFLKTHLRVNPNNWRIRPERLAMSYRNGRISFRNCRNPSQFMTVLAENFGGEHIYDTLPNIDNNIIFYLPPKSERLSTKYLNYKRDDSYNSALLPLPNPPSLNPSIPFSVFFGSYDGPYSPIYPEQGVIPPPSPSIVHVARIDVKTGLQQGYKFNLDCCRLDPRTFMQSSSKNGCIAINASYFNINSDFRPVGMFKTEEFESNNPIPDPYGQYYGLVAFKDGSLIIDNNLNNAGSYSTYFTCGPLLIYDGTPKFTQERVSASRAPDSFPLTGSGSGGPPGQLQHSNNPNPRTALAIDVTNNIIYFIYVEGRSERSRGLTCEELTKTILQLPSITHAINLDGGRSSQMTWRAPGKNTISIAGEDTTPGVDRASAYPVGNILSFCRQ
jgi:hypothetical protein